METKNHLSTVITMTEFNTPLGPMLAGATTEGLCILEFKNRIRLEKELADLQKLLEATVVYGKNKHLVQTETELTEYFAGSRKTFSVSLHTPGNEFAQSVWKALQEIPYGKTCSYKDQADRMNNPRAIRAIASTNGRNRLAIIIPCHRVIGSNGSMTGYAAGIDKKKWLLKFERENSDIPEGSLFK
ncbi:methylated-DNA--[protein]-cysteine S-methyltransferase [Pedobacter nyackensis]|uniref:methylated-DNA--[protein]-cysteine S-methyltransferase n=1 Tax=Pedobacter nyackensis TaxID=475255 RepID=UPI002931F4EE|nr:methylated-DNA--[protein]-cysteine S-methyltransferase [Pedobacter nyackensis]